MARIKIIIEDDNGQKINEEDIVYQLKISDGKFHTLEGEVDAFKKVAVAKITASLLEHEQNKLTQKKNRGVAKKRDKTR